MRLGLLIALCFVAINLVPAAAADVAIRTCNTHTSCEDQIFVRTSLVDCHVDLIKSGLGKPPRPRVDCVAT